MDKIKLRPYQDEVVTKLYNLWDKDENLNVMLQLPTGSGKSIIIAKLIQELRDKNHKVILQVHRKELVSQLSLTLCKFGLVHNIIAPTNVARQIIGLQRLEFNKQFYHSNSPIIVGSVDTINARADRLVPVLSGIRYVITDEAAHVLKDNKWGRALKLLPNTINIGFTATPHRLDKKGLGSETDGIYDRIVTGPTTRWLIDNKFLSKYKVVAPPSDFAERIEHVKTNTSDYSSEAIKNAAEGSQIIGDVVENYIKFANGTQAIVFAPTLVIGQEMADKFNFAGVPAKFLSSLSTDAERFNSTQDFANNKIQVLLNVDLFDEGYDCLKCDTEVLTPNGWKNHYEMRGESHCYAWNPITEKIQIVNVDRVIERQTRANEKFLNIESQHVDISVTENHNIYWRSKDYYTKNFRSEEHTVSKAKNIYKYQKPWSLPISGEMNFKGIDLTDDEIEFIGWGLTDAYLGKSNLTIFQSKPKYVIEIRNLLNRLNWSYHESITPKEKLPNVYGYKANFDAHRFLVHINNRFKQLKEFLNKDELNPKLHEMTRRQFKILWDTMMKANGTRQGNKNGKLCTTRKHHADFFMHMGTLRGYAMMYGTYNAKLTNTLVYNLGLRDSQYIQMTKRDKRGAKFSLKTENPQVVWCLTNKLGTLITRRNGKIAILGNCPVKEGKRIIETVILARPTMSLGKYLQQIGRALRPSPNKEYAIIIDHVSNVKRHGLPCKERKWSLDRPSKREKSKSMVRTCVECLSVYDRTETQCPYCGAEAITKSSGEGRVPPVQVDGDLELIDVETIRELEAKTILESPDSVAQRVTAAAGIIAGKSAAKKQRERIETQNLLKDKIAQWAGELKAKGMDDRSIHKEYFLRFDQTIAESLSEPNLQMQNTIEELDANT